MGAGLVLYPGCQRFSKRRAVLDILFAAKENLWDQGTSLTTFNLLRARSFGTIPEWEYTELTVIVFFWDLFWFRNEQNSILLSGADWRNRRNSGLLGIDRIAGNRVLLAGKLRARAHRSHHVNCCHISYSVSRIAQSLFFWELIFCKFCYSHTGIRIDGMVPKERALRLPLPQCVTQACFKHCISAASIK